MGQRQPCLANNGAVLWFIFEDKGMLFAACCQCCFHMLESNMARFLRPNIRSFVTSQLRMSSDQVKYVLKTHHLIKTLLFKKKHRYTVVCVCVCEWINASRIIFPNWKCLWQVDVISFLLNLFQKIIQWYELDCLMFWLHCCTTNSFWSVPSASGKRRSPFLSIVKWAESWPWG